MLRDQRQQRRGWGGGAGDGGVPDVRAPSLWMGSPRQVDSVMLVSARARTATLSQSSLPASSALEHRRLRLASTACGDGRGGRRELSAHWRATRAHATCIGRRLGDGGLFRL